MNSNKLIQAKLNAMKDIINGYNLYKGNKSELEKQFKSLRCKLTEEDFDKFKLAIEEYFDRVLNVLANSRRIYVKFDEKQIATIDIDFKTLFDEI